MEENKNELVEEEVVDPNFNNGNGKSSTGLDENVAGLLCYLFTIVTGIIFILIEKDSKFVRFHAMQSIILFGGVFVANFVLGFIPFIGWLLALILSMGSVVLWIILMLKAYKMEYYKLPYIGDYADDFANKN